MVQAIEITNNQQVERINRLACNAPYEVWLSNKIVMLDARSLMGLFSLVGQRVNVVVDDDVNPKSFSKLVKKMSA